MFYSPFEPVGAWRAQPLDALQRPPSPALLPWLQHPGSLTAALKQLSSNQFSVQVLSQRWQQPRREERLALDLDAGQRALIREVLLCGGGQPWVYARSVLPECCLEGESGYLRTLDNRPLGELLFSEVDIRRGPMAFNQLQRNPRSQLAELEHIAPGAWGRRSVFWLRAKPLLVAEAFLSSFNPQQPPLISGELCDQSTN